MIKEFKAFISKGNLVTLAVAFILGATFAAVVTAFTNVILSLVSAIFGGTAPFSDWQWCIGGDCGPKHPTGTPIPVGAFLNAVISFVIVAFVLFLIVKAYNRFMLKEEAATTKPCPFCLTEIPIAATRCPSCTSEIPPAGPQPTAPIA
ncbi:MAG: large conductance mechanosensitive channel [Actinomycetota bacterium]|jgi:large conductance mechanosensitive channel|nr:large conductance mechanosensitive channel [Actinomycetota bacterium]MEA2581727.1 large conductance mechanosensitive channel [Actinomycetota bacterium]